MRGPAPGKDGAPRLAVRLLFGAGAGTVLKVKAANLELDKDRVLDPAMATLVAEMQALGPRGGPRAGGRRALPPAGGRWAAGARGRGERRGRAREAGGAGGGRRRPGGSRRARTPRPPRAGALGQGGDLTAPARTCSNDP